MTEAILGYGSIFQIWDGTEWVTVAEASAMSLPPLSIDVIDAGHESAPGEWRDVVTGLKSAGEISISLNFTSAEYQRRFDDLSNGLIQCRILLPDESVYPFNAYETGLEVGVAVGEKISAAAKFKVKGEPGPLIIGLPFADGEPPAFYADFVNQLYWHHNTYYDNISDWMSSLGANFSRTTANTSALVRDESGQYQVAADFVPRFDHNDSGSPVGLLIEEFRRNWIANSLTMSGFGSNMLIATSTDHAAPYAPATVKKCTFNGSDSAACYVSADPSMSPNLGTTVALSCWVWVPTDASITRVFLTQEQTFAPWSYKDQAGTANADLSKRDQWQRIWAFVQSDNTGTNVPFPVLRFQTSTPGSCIYTTMWQIETSFGGAAMPSSWLPNSGALGTKAADILQFVAEGVTGYRRDQGTLLSWTSLPYMNGVADNFRFIAGLYDTVIGTNRMIIFRVPDGTNPPFTFGIGRSHMPVDSSVVGSVMGGVSASQVWFPDVTGGLTAKNAMAFGQGSGNANAYSNGVSIGSGGVSTAWEFPAGNMAFLLDGSGMVWHKVFAYWPKRVSNSELDRLTT